MSIGEEIFFSWFLRLDSILTDRSTLSENFERAKMRARNFDSFQISECRIFMHFNFRAIGREMNDLKLNFKAFLQENYRTNVHLITVNLCV